MAVEPLLLPSWHLLASVEEEYAPCICAARPLATSAFGKAQARYRRRPPCSAI